jgi:hypothetical protein
MRRLSRVGVLKARLLSSSLFLVVPEGQAVGAQAGTDDYVVHRVRVTLAFD